MFEDDRARTMIRSLMMGTARQPLPLDAPSLLATLALLGQQLRFRRPATVPVPPPVSAPFHEARPLVSDAARRPLLRLLGKGGRVDDVVAEAIMDALLDSCLALHPFDLPRLSGFLRAHGARLGGSAAAWNTRHDPPGALEWAQLSGTAKARRLEALRRTDPAEARIIIEATAARESPPTRLALVNALAIRLEAADQPLLEEMARDRAASVRQAAEHLLALMPGTPQAHRIQIDFLSRLGRDGDGGIRLEAPATVKSYQRDGWALTGLARVPLDLLLAKIGMTIDALAAVCEGDPILAQAVIGRATIEGRFELVTRLTPAAPLAWTSILGSEIAFLADGDAAQRWSIAAVRPDLWEWLPDHASFERLRAALKGALPETVGRVLLESAAWAEFLKSGHSSRRWFLPGILNAMACLTPPGLRPMLREQIANMSLSDDSVHVGRASRSDAERALVTLDLLDLIEPRPGTYLPSLETP